MKTQRSFTLSLFAVYFALLTWIILFKMQVSLSALQMPAAKLNVVPFAGSGAEGSVNRDMEDEKRKTEHESFKFRRRYEYIRKNFSGILCRYRRTFSGLCMRTVLFSMVSLPSD